MLNLVPSFRDALFRQAKATAALRGESLKEFVTSSISERLQQLTPTPAQRRGWRKVFGQAAREEVDEVDRIVAAELQDIDQESWS